MDISDQEAERKLSKPDRAGWLKVALPALIGLIGVLVTAFVTWEVSQVPIRATQTAEAKQTLAAQKTSTSTPTPSPTNLPPSTPPPLQTITPSGTTLTPSTAPVAVLTPPAPIGDPFCERSANAMLTYPQNGDRVSGIVEIRGKLETRGIGGKWYSLFYREGITRLPMNEDTHWSVPRPNWNKDSANQLIHYYEFPPSQNRGWNGVLGKWDTSRLPTGWYTVRVWFEELDAQFLACDIYVLVMQ